MLQTRGFVNYYGPQRFGNSQKVQADHVGLALLKEDMVTTIHLMRSVWPVCVFIEHLKVFMIGFRTFCDLDWSISLS